MQAKIENLSRRGFLQAGGAVSAGLLLGVPLAAPAQMAAGTSAPTAAPPAPPAVPHSAFVRIGTDNTVTVVCKHLEMGQGSYTGLATLVADELDAAWDQVRTEGAPADAALYHNLAWLMAFGAMQQGTGGSTAIALAYSFSSIHMAPREQNAPPSTW